MSLQPLPTADATVARRLTLGLLLGYLLYLYTTPYSALYFDSMTYWDLTGMYYYATKSFNLLSFKYSIRGYWWPLMLFPLRVVAYVTHIPPIQFTRALGAVLAAGLFGWLGPAVWQALVSPAALSWRRRLAFAGLGFVFWRDYFNFPLTDFLSLGLMLLVFWLVLRRGTRPGWLLVAGMLCMAAVNTRPVYAGAAALLLAGGLWLGRRYLHGRQLLRLLAAFLLGMAIIGAPQLANNVRHYGQWTPFVLTWKNPDKPQSLYLSQLAWGLAVQKYETTIDPDYPTPHAPVPEPRIMYVDTVGQYMMAREHITFVYGLRDLGQYFTVVRHYWPDLIPLYARHVFNGLDVKYPTPYLPRVYASTLPLSLLNYTVLFLTGLLLLRHRHGPRLTAPQLMALLVIVGPCLLAIPTAIECRFFIPVYLLCYAFLSFGWPRDWRPWLLRWPVGVAYVGFVLVCLMISSNTMWHMTNGPRLLWP